MFIGKILTWLSNNLADGRCTVFFSWSGICWRLYGDYRFMLSTYSLVGELINRRSGNSTGLLSMFHVSLLLQLFEAFATCSS